MILLSFFFSINDRSFVDKDCFAPHSKFKSNFTFWPLEKQLIPKWISVLGVSFKKKKREIFFDFPLFYIIFEVLLSFVVKIEGNRLYLWFYYIMFQHFFFLPEGRIKSFELLKSSLVSVKNIQFVQ